MMTTAIRSTALDELGDPNAPPGTRAWAVAVRMDIQTTLNDINGDARHLRVMIDLIREHKGYRQLADAKSRPFATFEAFCQARPPFGLGYDQGDIEAIIRERTARAAQERAADPPLLKKPGRPPKEPGGPAVATEPSPAIHRVDPGALPFGSPDSAKDRPEEKCANSTFFRSSTGAEHLTARIARDHPDILDRMKAGEFRSVRAAAREAGIVRPTAQIYTDRPEDAARALLKHFQGDRLDALIRALREGREGH